MAWKESDLMSLRGEFVRLASVEGANRSDLCKRFGISRKTGYKWLKRWSAAGDAGLVDQSRRPLRFPGKTSDSVEQAVLKIRAQHPAWGGRKIRACLRSEGVTSPPSASTITSILHRHGLVSDEESCKHQPYGQFERSEPNELWQVDFKGDFELSRGARCFPLTILDDHSRYSLGVLACRNQQRVTVQKHFENVFEQYGLPRAIYVDNGNPWGTREEGFRHTRFTVWLMRYDIRVIHGRPYYPQGRGKLERFHRSLKLEVLQNRQFSSFREIQTNFDQWRVIYNQKRPHESLDLDVPISRYRASDRSFPGKPAPHQYSDRFQVRRVDGAKLSFHGVKYRIGKPFNKESIGLAPTQQDGVWDVYFCRHHIAVLNEHDRTICRLKHSDNSSAPSDQKN